VDRCYGAAPLFCYNPFYEEKFYFCRNRGLSRGFPVAAKNFCRMDTVRHTSTKKLGA
jgi:hypothetical protein